MDELGIIDADGIIDSDDIIEGEAVPPAADVEVEPVLHAAAASANAPASGMILSQRVVLVRMSKPPRVVRRHPLPP
jgi:hypothetical protein